MTSTVNVLVEVTITNVIDDTAGGAHEDDAQNKYVQVMRGRESVASGK